MDAPEADGHGAPDCTPRGVQRDGSAYGIPGTMGRPLREKEKSEQTIEPFFFGQASEKKWQTSVRDARPASTQPRE